MQWDEDKLRDTLPNKWGDLLELSRSHTQTYTYGATQGANALPPSLPADRRSQVTMTDAAFSGCRFLGSWQRTKGISG